jgi:predicted nucleic acid-binding protein
MKSDAPIHLDSSIVIGLLNADDAHNLAVRDALKHARRKSERFVLSTAAYAETLVLPAVRGATALTHAKQSIAKLCFGDPVFIDREAAEMAASLRAKHAGLRSVDALVVASARTSGAKYLLTADKQLARLSGVRYVGE